MYEGLSREQLLDLERRMASDRVEKLERELAACRKALEPFARQFRWGAKIGTQGDDEILLSHRHWLTGEDMAITVDHFRIASVAYHWKGILPDQPSGEANMVQAMTAELERAEKEKTR